MDELVIQPDYMNAFRISFHISDAGIEYLKKTIHPRYVNEAPKIIERVFYPKHVLKGKIITITHKKEESSRFSQTYQKRNRQVLSFEQLRESVKSDGWKTTKQPSTTLTHEGDMTSVFYRFASMIHLGDLDIGPFTPENANRIYDFIKPAIEEFSDEKNTQMEALINTMGKIGSHISERGPAIVQLGAPSPKPLPPIPVSPVSANLNTSAVPKSKGGSKTRRRKSRK